MPSHNVFRIDKSGSAEESMSCYCAIGHDHKSVISRHKVFKTEQQQTGSVTMWCSCDCVIGYDHNQDGSSVITAEAPKDNWANLNTYACSTCRFFVPKNEVGRCRRHAPTMGGYPVVYATDWCGDHKMGTNPSRTS